MAKKKVDYVCQSCGYKATGWMAFCPSCRQYNTFSEEVFQKDKRGLIKRRGTQLSPMLMKDIPSSLESRIKSRIEELDRVLGGGIVLGSLVLIGGDPGIGKSTLLLQVCQHLGKENIDILYISGEESLSQIKMRGDRMGDFGSTFHLMAETDLERVEDVLRERKPKVAIIDSIQTIFDSEISSSPGSVSQVREVTARLMLLGKSLDISIFIVGHVTKEGTVAGPRVLEHMVDTVLYFEGDRHASYRILRSVKNRFGSTNEIGIFEMTSMGLMEVKNPSEYMLEGRASQVSGSIVTAAMEGTRPVLLEIQALVTKTNFGNPRRTAIGTDFNRFNLLIAIMEKHLRLPLYEYDAYINMTGGMKITEPGIDLAILLALISSFQNKSIHPEVLAIGEVGLSGEVRNILQGSRRVMEGIKLGFHRILLPATLKKTMPIMKDIDLIYIENIRQLFKIMPQLYIEG